MLVFFVALALLFRAQPASSGTINKRSGVSLDFYTDGGTNGGCTIPSTTNPNVTLGLNVCAVTTGLASFVLDPTPCSTGNNVAAWMFTDTACGSPLSGSDWYKGANDNMYCRTKFEGTFRAIMLVCDANANEAVPSKPTSTTTIQVGPVVDQPTSTSGGSTATTTSSGNSGGSSNSGTTTTDSTSAPSPSSSASGWNSLDYGAKVGIIVAIAVGIPPIIIGLYALSKRRG